MDNLVRLPHQKVIMQKNEIYQGVVKTLGSEGEGVIDLENARAFVPGCLGGEEVTFKALKVKGDVIYGKIESVVSPSPDRVAPRCGVYSKCGGCQLQHMDYSAQLAFKKQLVSNCLRKLGGIDFPVSDAVPSPEIFGYRNKLSMPVANDAEGNPIVGPYAPRSHRIVSVDNCVLQRGWCSTLISCLKLFMSRSGYKGYDDATRKGDIRYIVCRQLQDKHIITVVAARRIKLDAFAEILDREFTNFTLLLNVNSGTGNVIFSDKWSVCRGQGFFEGEDLGIKFRAGANTFLQINDGVRTALYSAIVNEVCSPNAVAIDLYSGGGMLTAMLARGCKSAYGIEVVKEAVVCAGELKEMNDLQDKMFNICGTVEDNIDKVLSDTEGYERVIVCDPPRKGMQRSVVRAIINSGAEKVVLVSCNPATLARDMGLLCGTLKEDGANIIRSDGDGAYRIESITPYDMFPQTKHIETLVVLNRK